jgi:hypothetical protein
MFRKLSFKFLLLVLVGFSYNTSAQTMLPDILGATEKGINLLSWNCQYEGVKSIAVQRSSDSVFNFVSIGYVKNLKKGAQAYIDGHPMPGNNWYRLYIVFNSDLTWYSNRFKLYVDSAAIMNQTVLPPNDSLQKLANNIKVDIGTSTAVTTADSLRALVQKLKISIPNPEEVNPFTYVRSQYVFTNPFTGHVNMELPDVKKHNYSIRFFDQANKRILEVERVMESPIIIDKRNFQKKGLFRFELMKGKDKLETGYITIY